MFEEILFLKATNNTKTKQTKTSLIFLSPLGFVQKEADKRLTYSDRQSFAIYDWLSFLLKSRLGSETWRPLASVRHISGKARRLFCIFRSAAKTPTLLNACRSHGFWLFLLLRSSHLEPTSPSQSTRHSSTLFCQRQFQKICLLEISAE